MTESEWLACTDPADMQHFLHYKVSERKWRLLACAYCRRVWHLFHDERSRQGIAAVERFADGQINRKKLGQAGSATYQAWWETDPRDDTHLGEAYSHAAEAVVRLTGTAKGWDSFEGVASELRQAICFASTGDPRTALVDERKAQCDLVRELLGNPFCAITLSPALLTWHDALVVHLAQAAYQERDLPTGMLNKGRLVILADALEEAGCQDQEILGHLRQPGAVHVRGCYVVDLLLAKE
jgi:hypothetical protein